MSGGMPVYRKQGDRDMWLLYNPNDKEWKVQSTSAKGTSSDKEWKILSDANKVNSASAKGMSSASGHAYLKCDPPCLPENGTKRTWMVGGGGFQLQADVDISIATPQEVVDNFKRNGTKVRLNDID